MTMRSVPSSILCKLMAGAVVAFWVAGCATDRLDAAAPSGVNLTGEWQLNVNLSDDPDKLGPDPDKTTPQRAPGTHRGHGGGGGRGGGGGGMPPIGSPDGPSNNEFGPTARDQGPAIRELDPAVGGDGLAAGSFNPAAGNGDLRAAVGGDAYGLPASGFQPAVNDGDFRPATNDSGPTAREFERAAGASTPSAGVASTLAAASASTPAAGGFLRVALSAPGIEQSAPLPPTGTSTTTGPASKTSRGASINRLLRAPLTMSITQNQATVTVKTNMPDGTQTADEYSAGTKTTIPYGNDQTADRTAGWRGPVFVVTTAVKKGGTREDDFAIDEDDGRLIMTTQTKGGRLGKVEITRVYDRVRGAGS
jgi:hypothetical protein